VNEVVEIAAPVFGLAALGYLATRTGTFSEQSAEGLARFVFDWLVPVFLFRVFSTHTLPDAFPWRLLAGFYGPALLVYCSILAAGRVTLKNANHGGVTIAISSSNAAMTRVAPNALAPGSASIEIEVADGQATITASAAGFTAAANTTRIVAAGVRIVNLPAVTSTLAGEDPFQIQVGIPDAGHNSLPATQQARAGGGGLTATITNSNAIVGQVKTTDFPTGAQTVTVKIAEGQEQSPGTVAMGGVAFDALAGGTSTVSAAIPGFVSIVTAARSIMISAPGMSVDAPAKLGPVCRQTEV